MNQKEERNKIIYAVDINDTNINKIVINGSIVTKGAFEIKTSKITDSETGEEYIEIYGSLVTAYYISELNSLENSRYYINGIDIIEENYGSKEEEILYKFTAQMIKVKYQIQYDPDEEKDKEENGAGYKK